MEHRMYVITYQFQECNMYRHIQNYFKSLIFFCFTAINNMPPKRDRPRKKEAPNTVADVGSTLGKSQHTLAQIDKDLEIERLRLENQKLREEIAKGKSQASSTTFPQPTSPIPRRVARRVLDKEGMPLQDFFGLRTQELKGGTVMLKQTKYSITPVQCRSKRKRG